MMIENQIRKLGDAAYVEHEAVETAPPESGAASSPTLTKEVMVNKEVVSVASKEVVNKEVASAGPDQEVESRISPEATGSSPSVYAIEAIPKVFLVTVAMAAAAAARRRSSDSRAQSSVSVVRVLGGMSGVPVLLLGYIFLARSPLLGRSPADST
jgi:hypothetical protein